MTIHQLCMPVAAAASFLVSDNSQSDEARTLRRAVDEAVHASTSMLLGEREQALVATFRDASQPDWDGYGANPVNLETLLHALEFSRLLPRSLPSPKISADPDGEIIFEWSVGARWVFEVSIGSSGRLSYSGIFKDCTAYGTELFDGALPESVEENLRRYCERSSAPSV